MISIEESRKILGKEFEGMTDKEIETFRYGGYEIINNLIDYYVEQEEKKEGIQ